MTYQNTYDTALRDAENFWLDQAKKIEWYQLLAKTITIDNIIGKLSGDFQERYLIVIKHNLL
jgi:hypothetical protein